MFGFVCRSCQNILRRSQNAQALSIQFARAYSTSTQHGARKPDQKGIHPPKAFRKIYVKSSQTDVQKYVDREVNPIETSKPQEQDEIDSFLATPTWSVRSLLPVSPPDPNLISDAQFDHLLRLSALQLPKKNREVEREKMKQTLLSQLHFVQDIQKVDTKDVEPLVVVRNETEEGVNDNSIGLEELIEALGNEEFIGRLKRPRRRREDAEKVQEEEWDCLATAGELVERGDERFFVVYSGKTKLKEGDDILSTIKIEKRLTEDDKVKLRRIEKFRAKRLNRKRDWRQRKKERRRQAQSLLKREDAS